MEGSLNAINYLSSMSSYSRTTTLVIATTALYRTLLSNPRIYLGSIWGPVGRDQIINPSWANSSSGKKRRNSQNKSQTLSSSQSERKKWPQKPILTSLYPPRTVILNLLLKERGIIIRLLSLNLKLHLPSRKSINTLTQQIQIIMREGRKLPKFTLSFPPKPHLTSLSRLAMRNVETVSSNSSSISVVILNHKGRWLLWTILQLANLSEMSGKVLIHLEMQI